MWTRPELVLERDGITVSILNMIVGPGRRLVRSVFVDDTAADGLWNHSDDDGPGTRAKLLRAAREHLGTDARTAAVRRVLERHAAAATRGGR